MQLQVTQTMLSPSGTPSETPSTTQPCLPSARKNTDWFEAHWGEMEPVAEAKRKALLDYKQNPWPNTRDARLIRPPATLPRSTGKLSAPRSSLLEGCTRGSKLPPALLASKQPCSNPRLARPSPTRASNCSDGLSSILSFTQSRILPQTLPSTPCLACQSWRSSITYPQRETWLGGAGFLRSFRKSAVHLAEHSLLRRGYLRTLPSQQWNEAGLCPGTYSIGDLFLDAPPIRICRLRRWSVRPDEA